MSWVDYARLLFSTFVRIFMYRHTAYRVLSLTNLNNMDNTMTKYNSVFHTFGFSIDHNNADASDVTDKQIVASLRELIANINEDGWKPWMTEPLDTEEK